MDVIMLFLAALRDDLIKELDDLLVDLISLVDGLDHLRFRNLVRAGFDHDDLLAGRSDRELQLGFVAELIARVDDELTVYEAELRHCARAVKRDVGDAGGKRAAEHGDNFRIAFRINGHNQVIQCDIVPIVLREQRPHRAVNNAAC